MKRLCRRLYFDTFIKGNRLTMLLLGLVLLISLVVIPFVVIAMFCFDFVWWVRRKHVTQ